jgi:hypothetical protein
MTDWMVNLQVNQLTRKASRLSAMCTLVRIRRTYTLSFARVELDGMLYFILVTWRKSCGSDGVKYMVGVLVLTISSPKCTRISGISADGIYRASDWP